MVQDGIGVHYSSAGRGDPWLDFALEEIKGSWGPSCTITNRRLLKFGRNADVDTTRETVWLPGGNETYISDNLITTVSSSDASDTQPIEVSGLTLSGSAFTNAATQTVTLDGQNKVTLTTPLARSTRLKNKGSTDLAGTVYCYEDDTITAGVPDTASKIHAQMDGTTNQTLQCAATMADGDYWCVTQFYVGIDKKTAASVVFDLQLREFGGVFRSQPSVSLHANAGGRLFTVMPYLIVPANADARIVATSDTANIAVTAWANGPIVKAD